MDQAAERMLEVLPAFFKQLWGDMRQTLPAEFGDIGETQFRIVHTLQHRDFTIGEMADCMRVRTPTISRMIDALVERGYVDRQADSADRRKVWLQLSQRGRALAEGTEACFHTTVAQLLEPLDRAQLDQIIRACDTLALLLPSAKGRESKLDILQEVQH